MKHLFAAGIAVLGLSFAQAAASTLTTLYVFNLSDGALPRAALVMDQAGNLYGTTSAGGSSVACPVGCGTVFQLSPPPAGISAGWARKTLVNFDGTNGQLPYAGVIMDSAGNLYGTTGEGGSLSAGTVYQLSPPAAGQTSWRRKTLVTFNGPNGNGPDAPLIMDQPGNVYGTTALGGMSQACTDRCGTVFQLSPPSSGHIGWTRKTLVNFGLANGAQPEAGLVRDSAGNLFGTTSEGGASVACPTRCGTVFELSPPAAGQTTWTRKTLVNFDWTNGALPWAGLVIDKSGNLYGTTSWGGQFSGGTVFKLSPPASGQTKWKLKTLVSFDGTNGSDPQGGVIMDSAGNLYGTTSDLRSSSGHGAVFELQPPASGQTAWTFKTLVSFNGTNGSGPEADLMMDQAGNLYGTTFYGGSTTHCPSGCGVVFKVTP